MRTYVSHLKISKTPIGDKNELSKNISKAYIKKGLRQWDKKAVMDGLSL